MKRLVQDILDRHFKWYERLWGGHYRVPSLLNPGEAFRAWEDLTETEQRECRDLVLLRGQGKRRVILGIIGVLLVLRVMFPVTECRGSGATLLPVSVYTDPAGARPTLAAGVAYLEVTRGNIDRDLAGAGTKSFMSLLNGEAAIQYAFDRQGPPAWLDTVYARAKATALDDLHKRGEQQASPPTPTGVVFVREDFPSGEVINVIDNAFQGAIAEVQAMTPVPWWQRLRMTWIGNQCPPSVGITALQALFLAGAFWYVHAQWK